MIKVKQIHLEHLAWAYLHAKSVVIGAGFADEIDYHNELRFDKVDAEAFLRECAWVILSSGMAERVIRAKFPLICEAFFEFKCAHKIVKKKPSCRRRAFRAFKHQGKIDAIIHVAELVSTMTFAELRQKILSEGIKFFAALPFVGPITSVHLAKNLGFDVVKPDRHLMRIARAAGFDEPSQLCDFISEIVGERTSVIDVVLWRYATIQRDYFRAFKAENSASYIAARYYVEDRKP